MKKFICGFLVGAILCTVIGVFAVSYVAETVNFKILVNGEEFKSDKPALAVDGSTYLPLKAVGDALGVPVEWNSELRQVEVGNSALVADKTQYSRLNPAPIGVIQEHTETSKYSEENNYTVSIRVLDIIRGAKAWAKIQAENQFNEKAPDGYEYLIANIAFSVVDTKTDRSVSISEYDFDVFTSNNAEVKQTSFLVDPEPKLSGEVYAGGSLQGYVVFTVEKGDLAPKFVYGANSYGSGGIWFSLAK